MTSKNISLHHLIRESSLPNNAPALIMLHGYGSDENDLFDENLDLFDYLQYGAFEDGIAYSKNHDEEELRDEENDTEYDLEDYDNLDD
jgi:predicted esterase